MPLAPGLSAKASSVPFLARIAALIGLPGARTLAPIPPAASTTRDIDPADVRLQPGPKPFHIPSLDGIRGVAFLLVFLGHAGWDLIPKGFGVTLFFFLSGYLITTLMRREIEQTGRVDLGAFYARRALRILPPYYLALGASILLLLAIEPWEFRWSALAAQVFQVTNFYWTTAGRTGIGVGMGVAWSLAVEEHFYLLFPLLYLTLVRRVGRRGQTAVLLALCGATLAWRCLIVDRLGASPVRIYMGTDTRADSLLFGCLLAVAANPVLEVAGKVRRWLDLALIPPAIVAFALTKVLNDVRFLSTLRYTLQGLALIPLFTAAIRYHDRWPFRWLSWRPVRTLGALSYSLYLIHLAVIELTDATGLSRVSQTSIAFVISLVLAYGMYRIVELPCGRLRKRYSRAA